MLLSDYMLRVAVWVLAAMLLAWHLLARGGGEVSPEFQLGLLALGTAALGWYMSHRNALALREEERASRMWDYREALRAEILAFKEHQSRRFGDINAAIEKIHESFVGETAELPFVPFVPSQKHNDVFEAISGNIHILPGQTIGPVVAYYQQIRSIELLSQDMRSEAYANLPTERREAVLRDYLGINAHALTLADEALHALNPRTEVNKGDQ